MAYKYDDFVTAANSAGMMNKFTQQDLVAAQKNPEYGLSMLSLMKDYDSSETEEQRLLATEAANQLRKTYGVTGQTGSSFYGTAVQAQPTQTPATSYSGAYDQQIGQVLGQLGSFGDFNYSGEDAYQQQLQGIINQQPFTYDPEKDPRYAAYKKTYLREGDRATANALAQASAATGGVPSSYAATAAAQAGNYYAGQVADVIPQLYEDSYNQYLNDFQMKLSGLGALQDDRNFGYQEYLDKYNMLQQNLGILQQQEQTERDRYLDQWNIDRTEEQDAYEKLLAQYEMLGYATPEIAEKLGINADLSQKQIIALQKAMNSMGYKVTVDGIIGKKSNEAIQKLGYMDAWPAYQAMVAAGLIDDQGNYIGPATGNKSKGKNSSTGGIDPGTYDVNADDFFTSVMSQAVFGGNNNQYTNYLYTQAKSMFENGDMSYADYNKVMDVLDAR